MGTRCLYDFMKNLKLKFNIHIFVEPKVLVEVEKVLQTIEGKKVLLLTVKFFGEETFLWHCYKELFPAALFFKSVLPTYLPFRQSGRTTGSTLHH